MTRQGIEVRHPGTGELVGVCPGPTAAGTCPFSRKNGVVPCAGLLVSPPHGDRRFWPLTVPPDHRYCELGWNARALACLSEAEACRAKWQNGAASETKRVFARAAAGDPRYKRMTTGQLKTTGLWRWRLSTAAIQLTKAEEKQRERAQLYLRFAEFRRLSTVQGTPRRSPAPPAQAQGSVEPAGRHPGPALPPAVRIARQAVQDGQGISAGSRTPSR